MSSGRAAQRRRRRRSGRVTPYSTQRKAAASRSADFMPDHVPTSDQVEALKGIVSKTWHLHHVSPLWNLHTTRARLRGYSHLLTTHLAASGRGGAQQLSAEVTLLQRFGLDGSHALRIDITQRGARKNTPTLEAILCRLTEEQAQEGFTALPLLLLRGPAHLSQLVLGWLQSSFDCHLSPTHLSSEDLTMIVGQYATAERASRGMGCVELVYSLPSSLKQAGLSTLALELPFESAVTVWNSTCHTQRDRRKAFVQALSDHIHCHFHLKLASMTLTRVSTPVLHAERDGRIKFTSISCVVPVLSFLQS